MHPPPSHTHGCCNNRLVSITDLTRIYGRMGFKTRSLFMSMNKASHPRKGGVTVLISDFQCCKVVCKQCADSLIAAPSFWWEQQLFGYLILYTEENSQNRGVCLITETAHTVTGKSSKLISDPTFTRAITYETRIKKVSTVRSAILYAETVYPICPSLRSDCRKMNTFLGLYAEHRQIWITLEKEPTICTAIAGSALLFFYSMFSWYIQWIILINHGAGYSNMLKGYNIISRTLGIVHGSQFITSWVHNYVVTLQIWCISRTCV